VEEYLFTEDWGEPFRSTGDRILRPLAGRALSYLEIGVYEARSLVWMLDNILVHPGSRAAGVDYKVRPNAWANLERHGGKVAIYEGWSEVIIPQLSGRFDIVYIDGDHSARGALFDTVMSWPRLRQGGIMIWDDYADPLAPGVKASVGHFLSCYGKGDYELLADDWQFAVRKLREDHD
jgi:predicted O-methyltransferase YrrM